MTDTTRPRSRWPGTLVWLAVLVSLHVTRGSALLFVVPRCKKVYDEFNLQLPWVTKTLVQCGDWWCKYWYFAGPLSLLLMAAGVIGGRHLFRRTWPGNVYAAVWLFLLVAWLALVGVGLNLPQLKLMEGLSK
jgi:type II secretory pathway component PulF